MAFEDHRLDRELGDRGDVLGVAEDEEPGERSSMARLSSCMSRRVIDQRSSSSVGRMWLSFSNAGIRDPCRHDVTAVSSFAGVVAKRDLGPRQTLEEGVKLRVVVLDDRDVVRVLGLDEEAGVGALGVQRASKVTVHPARSSGARSGTNAVISPFLSGTWRWFSPARSPWVTAAISSTARLVAVREPRRVLPSTATAHRSSLSPL
ncbi:hypothetical protein [Streptomyces avermitilis]|uniref:hypothetical protein n=1 Tax=Streptomyces avermitilis TaxID=33903 RepID=UPI0038269248